MSDYKGAIQEKRFEYKGFPCVILMQGGAFRTGYVGIPKGNKLYGSDYGELNIDCHGGLTYSRDKLIDQTDKDLWWIGFDTAHWGDGKDFESAFELFKDYPGNIQRLIASQNIEKMFPSNEQYRSLEYCETQCKDIVNQILEMEKE